MPNLFPNSRLKEELTKVAYEYAEKNPEITEQVLTILSSRNVDKIIQKHRDQIIKICQNPFENYYRTQLVKDLICQIDYDSKNLYFEYVLKKAKSALTIILFVFSGFSPFPLYAKYLQHASTDGVVIENETLTDIDYFLGLPKKGNHLKIENMAGTKQVRVDLTSPKPEEEGSMYFLEISGKTLTGDATKILKPVYPAKDDLNKTWFHIEQVQDLKNVEVKILIRPIPKY